MFRSFSSYCNKHKLKLTLSNLSLIKENNPLSETVDIYQGIIICKTKESSDYLCELEM